MAVAVLRPLILARLLGPDDFGVVAVSFFIITAVQVLTDPGLNFALIQTKTASDLEYDSLWTFSALRGLILGGLVAVFCGAVGRIFHDHRVVGTTLALAAIPVLSGLLNTHYVVGLQRDLKIGRIALGQLLLSTSDLLVSATVAFITRSFWALIIGLIVSNALVLIYSFVAVQTWPSLSLRWSMLRPFWGYSKYILAGAVLYSLFSQFDNAVVARILDVAHLGYYKMAYGLAFFATGGFTAINNTVIFPTLSRLHHEEEGAASTFFRFFRSGTAGVCLLLVVLVSVPKEIISLLFGPRWLPAADALPVLAVAAVFRAVMELIVPYFAASGRPQRTVYAMVLQVVPFASLIVPLTERFGFEGTSWAVLASYAVGLCAGAFMLEYDPLGRTGAGRKVIRIVLLHFLLACAAIGSGLVLRPFVSSAGLLERFGAIVSMALLIYGILICLVDRVVVHDLIRFLQVIKCRRSDTLKVDSYLSVQ